MTCKNCRYWQHDDKYGFGTCDLIGLDMVYAANKDIAIIDVSADDDSNLNANLKTKENFGCVLFTEK